MIGHLAQRLRELVDVILEDDQADPVMLILALVVLGLDDVDEAGAAGLLLEVEVVGSLASGYLLAVNLLGSHSPP